MARGADVMGRRKTGEQRRELRPEERPTVINLKGTPAYIEWLERVHKKTYLPKATMVRIALAEWAAKNGHEPPPEI